MHRSATPGRTYVRGVNKGIRDGCHIACDICHSLLACVFVCLGIIFRCWQQRQHIKRGHILSQNHNIHKITEIEIIAGDHPNIPTIDLIIRHKNYDGSIAEMKLDLFTNSYAELGAILQAMLEDCLKAIVVGKTVEANATK